MNWNNPKLRLFNLDKKEKEILNLVSDDFRSIHELSAQSPLPRTTIKFTIDGLVERDFVIKKVFGKRYKYKSIPDFEVRKRVIDANLYLKNQSEESVTFEGLSDIFEAFEGVEAILKEYDNIMRENKKARVYAIQPIVSSNIMHDTIGRENVKRITKSITENEVIIDTVLESGFYKEFEKKHLSGPGRKEYGNTFTDRAADYSTLPIDKYDWDSEIWIVNTTIYAISWKDMKALKINDGTLTSIVTGMYKVMKEFGKRINHKLEVERILEKEEQDK